VNLARGPALSGLRFADFDGDGRTDVFATKPLSMVFKDNKAAKLSDGGGPLP
jgi:hypothetical protein